ncbi:NUDIX domain-containing protein [Patescibacteria group bacterium]|nr:NUDIX domain-containing protein [Patescibacteria group bacterium]
MNKQEVRVGVGTFVFREGKFLMQQRQGSHGEGSWSVPGGHLEFGETPEETSKREVLEETGMDIKDVKFAAVTNDYFSDDGKHYVTWWTMSEWHSGEPYITEPDKCTAQMWVDFSSLPEPLFKPWEQLLEGEFIERIKNELARTAVKGAGK